MTRDFDEQLRTLAERAATAARPVAAGDIRRRGNRRRRVRTAGIAVAVVALVAGTFGAVEMARGGTDVEPTVIPRPTSSVVPPSPSATRPAKPMALPGPDRRIALMFATERPDHTLSTQRPGPPRTVQAMLKEGDDHVVGDVMAPPLAAGGSATEWRFVNLNPPGHRFQLEALNADGSSRGCATALAELGLRLEPCRSDDTAQSWVVNPVVGGLQIEGLTTNRPSYDLLAVYEPETSYVTVVPVDRGPVR